MELQRRWCGVRTRGKKGAKSTVRPRFAAIAAVAVTASLLAGCGDGGKKSGDTGAATETLTIGIDSGPSNLDSAKDSYGLYSTMRYLSNETLLKLNADGSYSPWLATKSGYVGSGNTVYEFTLRQDAKFSNGKVLDADAAAAWFNYFRNAGGSWSDKVPLKSATVVDKWTVRLNLSAPNPNMRFFLATTGWAFISDVSDPELLARQTVGVGPYKLVAAGTIAGQSYAFEPNKEYYDQTQVRYRKVVVKVMSSPATMLRAIQAGELDIALGDTSTVEAASKVSSLEVLSARDGGYVGFEFVDRNGDLSKPLGDPRVRQALNYAVDRKTITKAMVGEWAEPTSSWITQDGNVAELQDAYPYDPAKAKQLLAAAGYPDGFTFKVLGQNFGGNLGDPMVQAVAADWAKIGVKVDIRTANTRGDFFAEVAKGTVSAYASSTGLGVVDMLGASRFVLGGPLNPFKVDDTKFVELMKQGESATEDKQPAYWQAITRRMSEEAVQVPVFTYPVIVYANDSVAGLDKAVSKYFQYTSVWRSARPAD